MRAVGIDPGTGSFDFFGMDGQTILIDTTISVAEVFKNPGILIDTIRQVMPLDVIVGPSGYGLPVTQIKNMGQAEIDLMVPDDKSIPLYDGIRATMRLMKSEGLPVVFTPGVIHLPTVPTHRKVNKIDMGTADKVCCSALAVKDQAERLGIAYEDTSFILVEVGYAFTSVIAVENGAIVDGIGGTSGGPGFISLGSMDSELAVRLGDFPGALLFTGGAKDASGFDGLTPEQMAQNPLEFGKSWQMMTESILKSVAAMNVSVEKPREILFSGRISRIPEFSKMLVQRLARFGNVSPLERTAKTAKEAAEGAFIIAEGLAGGKYQPITDCLSLKCSSGTMFDHVLVKGLNR